MIAFLKFSAPRMMRLKVERFSSGEPPEGTSVWVMFSAVVAARETSTRTGLWRKASARRVISGGIVAEKNSVWRVNGTSLQMRSMSGMKPMSSIRSASSMTRISIAFRSRPPRPVKSSRRPGVAMTTSAPRAILVS